MYVCSVTFGMTSATMFYYTNVLNTLFIQTPGDPTNPGSTFSGINVPQDWFDVSGNLQLICYNRLAGTSYRIKILNRFVIIVVIISL